MIYLKIALIWCVINLPITFIAWGLKTNMFYTSLFFLIGFMIILCFGMIEAIRKDRKRMEDNHGTV